MVRPVWVAVALVAGILIGFAGARLLSDAPDAPAVGDASLAHAQDARERLVPAPVTPIAPASSPAPRAAGSPAATDPRVAAMPPATPSFAGSDPVLPRAPEPPAPTMPAGGHNPFPPLPPDDGSPVAEPIDPGEPFRTAMKKLTPEADTIADAHRALERETRDDAWSYRSESDIQSALIPETAAGNFAADYVTCRATLCEVRLSATNETQGEALRAWADGLGKQPWAKSLFPMYSSSITKNGRTDRIVILRRPK